MGSLQFLLSVDTAPPRNLPALGLLLEVASRAHRKALKPPITYHRTPCVGFPGCASNLIASPTPSVLAAPALRNQLSSLPRVSLKVLTQNIIKGDLSASRYCCGSVASVDKVAIPSGTITVTTVIIHAVHIAQCEKFEPEPGQERRCRPGRKGTQPPLSRYKLDFRSIFNRSSIAGCCGKRMCDGQMRYKSERRAHWPQQVPMITSCFESWGSSRVLKSRRYANIIASMELMVFKWDLQGLEKTSRIEEQK